MTSYPPERAVGKNKLREPRPISGQSGWNTCTNRITQAAALSQSQKERADADRRRLMGALCTAAAVSAGGRCLRGAPAACAPCGAGAGAGGGGGRARGAAVSCRQLAPCGRGYP